MLERSAVKANHVAYKQLCRKRREVWSSDKIKKSKVPWKVSLGKKYKDTKKKKGTQESGQAGLMQALMWLLWGWVSVNEMYIISLKA